MSETRHDGAWFVYTWGDSGAYPIALFDTAESGMRWLQEHGGGYALVVFWPFGLTWDEVRPR
jgi:hypothetical protein